MPNSIKSVWQAMYRHAKAMYANYSTSVMRKVLVKINLGISFENRARAFKGYVILCSVHMCIQRDVQAREVLLYTSCACIDAGQASTLNHVQYSPMDFLYAAAGDWVTAFMSARGRSSVSEREQ